jgi:hypothetical protein
MRDDATGKTFNYMHLDPKLWDEEKHLNKKYKRGDLIHEASSYRVLDLKQATYKASISSIGADGKTSGF